MEEEQEGEEVELLYMRGSAPKEWTVCCRYLQGCIKFCTGTSGTVAKEQVRIITRNYGKLLIQLKITNSTAKHEFAVWETNNINWWIIAHDDHHHPPRGRLRSNYWPGLHSSQAAILCTCSGPHLDGIAVESPLLLTFTTGGGTPFFCLSIRGGGGRRRSCFTSSGFYHCRWRTRQRPRRRRCVSLGIAIVRERMDELMLSCNTNSPSQILLRGATTEETHKSPFNYL